jgi:hypothetical protein
MNLKLTAKDKDAMDSRTVKQLVTIERLDVIASYLMDFNSIRVTYRDMNNGAPSSQTQGASSPSSHHPHGGSHAHASQHQNHHGSPSHQVGS